MTTQDKVTPVDGSLTIGWHRPNWDKVVAPVRTTEEEVFLFEIASELVRWGSTTASEVRTRLGVGSSEASQAAFNSAWSILAEFLLDLGPVSVVEPEVVRIAA